MVLGETSFGLQLTIAMVGVKYLVFVLALAFTLLLPDISQAQQLSTSFYSSTCPSVYDIVKSNVRSAVNREKRIGASILRLIFHDCFVAVCSFRLLGAYLVKILVGPVWINDEWSKMK